MQCAVQVCDRARLPGSFVRTYSQAWAIVGVSVAGALLGAAAHRGGALLLKRRHYSFVGT